MVHLHLKTIIFDVYKKPLYDAVERRRLLLVFNPLKGRLKPQSNEPLYSNTVIGTLAVDGWAVTFSTARRGLGGLEPCPVPSSLYQM